MRAEEARHQDRLAEHEAAGEEQAELPPLLVADEVQQQQDEAGAENVAEAGVRSPDAEDGAAALALKPVAHDRHVGGPAGRLRQPVERPQQRKVPEAAQPDETAEAEERGERRREREP